MTVNLYYPDSDYLAALEHAALAGNLIAFRLRLFSNEALWKSAVLTDGFSGIAAAPRSVFDTVQLKEDTKRIILSDQFSAEQHVFCIYEPIDKMNQIVKQLLIENGHNDNEAGLHCIFSFAAPHQQYHSFAALKSQLRLHFPLASIINITSLTGFAVHTEDVLSEWLWEGMDGKLKEGVCYSLAHTPNDLIVATLPEWKEKLVNALQRSDIPIWLWCGSEWSALLFKLIPQIKSICWICEHPKDFELAQKWMAYIKSEQPGTGGYLICHKERQNEDYSQRLMAFDSCFETLEAYLQVTITGRRG